MDKEKNNIYNKYIPIILILLSITSVFIIVIKPMIESNQPLKDKNYLGCYKVGLCKIDGEARQPTKLDIDTGVRLQKDNGVFALIQSRNFETLDFGQTFLVRIK